MNKRVEILKKVAEFNKKKKIPKKIIIIELTVLLLTMYLVEVVKNAARKILKMVFPNTKKVLTYVTLGVILGIFVLPHSHMKLDDEKAYGDVNSINETQKNNNIASYGELEVYDVSKDYEENETKIYTEEELLSMSFYIKVNRLMNCVTIYTLDENGEYTIPIKAMICSTGGSETPLGVYSTKERYVFRRLLYDVYGQYATRIEGQILFHSASYQNGYKDTLIAEEFNKLGSAASHGCIRLTTEDAKWIYDCCKIGTTVEIYEDDNPGPLGKPEMLKVPEDTMWDPTDIDPANPWNNAVPVINAEDLTVNAGEKVDLLSGVKAVDTCGNDISDKVKIIGKVDINVEGIYEIKYTVTDLIGRSTEKSVNVVVKGNEYNDYS